jgi:hypothetical protein
MQILGEKKRKRALREFKDNINEICDLYFLQKQYIDTKKDKQTPTNYYVYKVSEICEKFRISTGILRFLVIHHLGKEVKYCEFCGHTVKKIKFRESTDYFVDDCGHTGICGQCEKPCDIDEYGFCYTCNPRQYVIPEMNHLNTDIAYLFAHHLSRFSFSEIENIETLKALRNYTIQLLGHLESLINQ